MKGVCMPTRSLPPRPNLNQLKLQATELERAHPAGQLSAAARILAHHPKMKGRSPQVVLDQPLTRAAAQLVIAREYGFQSWTQLKHRVELGSRIAKFTSHPRFYEAVAAIDAGDIGHLRNLIA